MATKKKPTTELKPQGEVIAIPADVVKRNLNCADVFTANSKTWRSVLRANLEDNANDRGETTTFVLFQAVGAVTVPPTRDESEDFEFDDVQDLLDLNIIPFKLDND